MKIWDVFDMFDFYRVCRSSMKRIFFMLYSSKVYVYYFIWRWFSISILMWIDEIKWPKKSLAIEWSNSYVKWRRKEWPNEENTKKKWKKLWHYSLWSLNTQCVGLYTFPSCFTNNVIEATRIFFFLCLIWKQPAYRESKLFDTFDSGGSKNLCHVTYSGINRKLLWLRHFHLRVPFPFFFYFILAETLDCNECRKIQRW